MLGNLARGTYVGSSDYVWPFSYNKCADDNRVSQEINACAKVGHFGMDPGRGRGAPEIDILEAMGGEPGPLPNTHVQRPYFSASLQVNCTSLSTTTKLIFLFLCLFHCFYLLPFCQC